jgi:acyl carrier protein
VKESSQIDKVRALIADHLGVDIKLVTDEAHFTEDLGADWLDRLELTMLLEDQFTGLEISDDVVDQKSLAISSDTLSMDEEYGSANRP